MNRSREKAKPLGFSEPSVPLSAWGAEEARDPIETLRRDVCDLIREVAEVKQARMEQERESSERMRKAFLSTIEVLDGFERVFGNIRAKEDRVDQQMKIWVSNFRTVYRLLMSRLGENGVVELAIDPPVFDPARHKIVRTVLDPAQASGTIVEIAQKGYLWRDDVIRKAEVVVVRNEAGAETEDGADS